MVVVYSGISCQWCAPMGGGALVVVSEEFLWKDGCHTIFPILTTQSDGIVRAHFLVYELLGRQKGRVLKCLFCLSVCFLFHSAATT